MEKTVSRREIVNRRQKFNSRNKLDIIHTIFHLRIISCKNKKEGEIF
ncbi:hypothetical protein GCWU000341_02058 [Oribacterium sp. oral taxon 078 str. F0262]|nr:hypothetical protein GCWU000341_02058 [Oribacterium sp. oral taxon 078 str. F0262]